MLCWGTKSKAGVLRVRYAQAQDDTARYISYSVVNILKPALALGFRPRSSSWLRFQHGSINLVPIIGQTDYLHFASGLRCYGIARFS
jgi:hypothetical protein